MLQVIVGLQCQFLDYISPVGILVMMLGLPWPLAWHGAALVPVSHLWRGPVDVALGRLQRKYQ